MKKKVHRVDKMIKHKKKIDITIIAFVLVILLVFPVIAQYIPIYPFTQAISIVAKGYEGQVTQGTFVWQGFIRYPDFVPLFYIPLGIIQEAKATFFGTPAIDEFCLTAPGYYKQGTYRTQVGSCHVMVFPELLTCYYYGYPYPCYARGMAEFRNWKKLPVGTTLRIVQQDTSYQKGEAILDGTTLVGTGSLRTFDIKMTSPIDSIRVWSAPTYGYHYFSARTIKTTIPKDVKVYYDEKLILKEDLLTDTIVKNLLPHVIKDKDKKFVLKAFTSNNEKILTSVVLKWMITPAKLRIKSKKEALIIESFDSYSGEKIDKSSGIDFLVLTSQKVDLKVEDPKGKFSFVMYGLNLTKTPECFFDIYSIDEEKRRIYNFDIDCDKERLDVELDYSGMKYKKEEYLALKRCENNRCEKIPFSLDKKNKKIVFSTDKSSEFIISEDSTKAALPLVTSMASIVVGIALLIFVILKKKKKFKTK